MCSLQIIPKALIWPVVENYCPPLVRVCLSDSELAESKINDEYLKAFFFHICDSA